MESKSLMLLLLTVFITLPNNSSMTYPIDGYKYSGIRRLARLNLILEGKYTGTKPVSGAQISISDIHLNLMNPRGDSLSVLPGEDVEVQRKINALFPNRDASYSLVVLDISPGKKLRYASRNPDRKYPPGSVGKLAIAAGLFTELSRLYPESTNKRLELLKSRLIIADRWIHSDHHTVPIFDPEANSYTNRQIQEGDTFSLYEWADHMLSASANSAASVVWKELILMRAFQQNYPPTLQEEAEFFKTTSKSDLQTLASSVVNDPLRSMGITQEDWQLGSFFTSNGKKIIPGSGGSFGSPKALLQFLIALERGKIVDPWSSLEIKRLMYMTARRIRYAASPAIEKAAVYFKSGSQYRCKPEQDFICEKYKGNVENYMNSVAIVEHPDNTTYMVVLMSNILRQNSAVEHQSLATFIDRIIRK